MFVLPLIAHPIQSRNVWDTRHWSKRAKERELWGWLLREAVGHTSPQVLAALTQPTCTDVWFVSCRARLLDDDNLVGGFKYCRDALKHLGWIVDDSPTWLQATYRQEQKKPYGTIVTIGKRYA